MEVDMDEYFFLVCNKSLYADIGFSFQTRKSLKDEFQHICQMKGVSMTCLLNTFIQFIVDEQGNKYNKSQGNKYNKSQDLLLEHPNQKKLPL
ncbi:hypothetical protein [Arcobacter porcinus]|uniref:hypothetical protein n=1 Tax=Arcobacter porcinus TaxID=1935204 RepID=UPI0008256304|nr:hypothetical protein [Arcobacter porcinus]OCL86631.1 hypothetical protein AAX30_01356 [Arcobacter porcinus]